MAFFVFYHSNLETMTHDEMGAYTHRQLEGAIADDSMSFSEMVVYDYAPATEISFGDSINISEVDEYVIAETYLDSMSIIDLLSQMIITEHYYELMGFTDRLAADISVVLSEVFGVADTYDYWQANTYSDNLIIADTFSVQIFQSLSDSFNISGALSSELKDTAQSLSDTLVIADSITGIVALISLSDDLSIRDYKSLGFSGAFAVIRDMHLDDLYEIEGTLIDVSWNN